jgi:hypothetical protein
LATRQRGYPQPGYIVVDRKVLPLAGIPTSVLIVAEPEVLSHDQI